MYIRTNNDEVVNVDDDLVAMMSGGVLDVESFLISRNTLGNGKQQTQNLKGKCQMVVAECGGGCGSIGGNLVKMGYGVGNAEVEGKVVDYTRCRSWKHSP